MSLNVKNNLLFLSIQDIPTFFEENISLSWISFVDSDTYYEGSFS
jgi:hypothetical protein